MRLPDSERIQSEARGAESEQRPNRRPLPPPGGNFAVFPKMLTRGVADLSRRAPVHHKAVRCSGALLSTSDQKTCKNLCLNGAKPHKCPEMPRNAQYKKGPAGRASKRNPEKSETKKRLGGGLVDKIGQKLHIKKATPERSTWENLCFIDKGSAELHPPGSPLNFQKEPKSSTKKSTKPPPVPAGGGLSVCLRQQADGVIVSCARSECSPARGASVSSVRS